MAKSVDWVRSAAASKRPEGVQRARVPERMMSGGYSLGRNSFKGIYPASFSGSLREDAIVASLPETDSPSPESSGSDARRRRRQGLNSTPSADPEHPVFQDSDSILRMSDALSEIRRSHPG